MIEQRGTGRQAEGALPKAGYKNTVLVIACGALAREITALCRQQGLTHITLRCLPALLHNAPHKIPSAVEAAILKGKAEGFQSIFVAFADCGTGGLLDKVLTRHNIRRLPGAHCYAFFTGTEAFEREGSKDMRSFFLTDFLTRQFHTLVIKGLGLDRHPELRESYFGAYDKLVYLAQTDDPQLDKAAQRAAKTLSLAYERRLTGYGDLETALQSL